MAHYFIILSESGKIYTGVMNPAQNRSLMQGRTEQLSEDTFRQVVKELDALCKNIEPAFQQKFSRRKNGKFVLS